MVAPTMTFNPFDQPSEGVRGFQRSRFTLGNDCLSETPSLRLFAEVAKNLFQLRRAERIDDLPGVEGLPPVHAHIQPRLRAKAETSFRIVDLMRRNTKIQDHAVDRLPVNFVENLLRRCKTRLTG